MNIVGTLPVRNEDWILGLSARAALLWCDALVILDHASTDRTPEIIADLQAEYPGRVDVIRTGGIWDEMNHRQMMLERARTHRPTHIAIIDADEVLTADLAGQPMRDIVAQVRPGLVLNMPGYNLRGGIEWYHSNGIWGKRWFSTAFVDDQRLHWGGDQFHHREPMGAQLTQCFGAAQNCGGTLHFWGASERRLVAKHELYKITEAIRFPRKPRWEINKLYGLAFVPDYSPPHFERDWKYAQVPHSWTAPYSSWISQYLHVDAEPWQEAECRRLLAQHSGSHLFDGLELDVDVTSAAC